MQLQASLATNQVAGLSRKSKSNRERLATADKKRMRTRNGREMRKFISVYILISSSLISLAQTVAEPQGGASVVFASAGGRWEKATITDQLSGETSTTYSLDAATPSTFTGMKRHPRIVLTCRKSGQFDRVRIRTGIVVANLSNSVSDHSFGWSRVSMRIDDREIQVWRVGITKNGSDFSIDGRIIFDLAAHERFSIRFVSPSGNTITDDYLTRGLPVESLRADCPSLFRRR
jgi:hypothetical protein